MERDKLVNPVRLTLSYRMCCCCVFLMSFESFRLIDISFTLLFLPVINPVG